MNTIVRSFTLLKVALKVLLRERKLFLFPFVNAGLVLGIAAFFLIPVYFYPTEHGYFTQLHVRELAKTLSDNATAILDSHSRHPHQTAPPAVTPWFMTKTWLSILSTCVYFISMFLATFINTAFYHEIMQALNGQPVSLRRGLRFASQRWQAILLWSLFAGLVGLIIRHLEERFSQIGRFIAGLLGLAWSVSCIFILPTLVRDTATINPVQLLKNSASTLRTTWGELVIGYVGVEAALITILLGTLFTYGMGTMALYWALPGVAAHYGAAILFGGLGIMLTEVIVLSWLSNLINPVYRSALYIYATEGVVPEHFDQELLDTAWKVK